MRSYFSTGRSRLRSSAPAAPQRERRAAAAPAREGREGHARQRGGRTSSSSPVTEAEPVTKAPGVGIARRAVIGRYHDRSPPLSVIRGRSRARRYGRHDGQADRKTSKLIVLLLMLQVITDRCSRESPPSVVDDHRTATQPQTLTD